VGLFNKQICDFGMAKGLDSIKDNKERICTREYRAPEMIMSDTPHGKPGI
jgi:serine/threonine protein kinase